jgi:photosystem II stability/assembly factor-like uncharacterized protein
MATERVTSRIASFIVVAAALAVVLATPAGAAPASSPDGLWSWSAPLPHGYGARSISASAAGTLFVTTTEPDALIAGNGGLSWSWSHTGSVAGFAHLDGLLFASAQEGWAWGGDALQKSGMLLHTADGGASWQLRLSVPGRSLGPLSFGDADSGWLLASAPFDSTDQVLYVTTNAGQSWTEATLPADTNATLASLAPQGAGQALLSQTLWSAGSGSGDELGSHLWRTTDYGAHWSGPTTLKGANLTHVCFSSTAQGWAIDDLGGWIWATAPGGGTWHKVHRAAVSQGLWNITSIGADVWAVGHSGSLHSVDSGKSWHALAGISGDLVSFFDRQDGWIVGSQYLHTSDGGKSWTRTAERPLLPQVTKLSSVGGTVWGAAGYVIRSANGGRRWTRVTQRRGLTAVAALSATTAWSVGRHGLIVHTADGGRHWTTQPSGVKLNLSDVVFVDAHRAWASGDKGTLLRTLDGGRHWRKSARPVSIEIRTLAFADAMHGMALTHGSRSAPILATSDGGRTWRRLHLPLASDLPTALSMQDASHALIIAADLTGHLAHSWVSADGGVTWQREADLPSTDDYVALARSGSLLCAVGNLGSVVTSKDDGVTWTDDGTPSGRSLASVQFVGLGALVIGGESAILTRDLSTAPLR